TPRDVIGEFHADTRSRHSRVLDASPIAETLLQLVQGTLDQRWEGLVGELLKELNETRTVKRPPKDWPPDAARLSGHLQRIQTSLGAIGLHLEIPKRTERGQTVILTY